MNVIVTINKGNLTMPQLSVAKEKVADTIARIIEDGGKILKSKLSENKKEVVLIYDESAKSIDKNAPAGPVIETNTTPDAPAMNKVIPPNIDKPLVSEIPQK
jgi:hypothetical protein